MFTRKILPLIAVLLIITAFFGNSIGLGISKQLKEVMSLVSLLLFFINYLLLRNKKNNISKGKK